MSKKEAMNLYLDKRVKKALNNYCKDNLITVSQFVTNLVINDKKLKKYYKDADIDDRQITMFDD